jgi:hypothetical protein
MPQYTIEARSLSIVGGTAGHDFWVLRDENGKALAELHGLATDRKTNEFVPVGTDEEKHSLRVWHFAHDPGYAKAQGEKPTSDSFISDGQAHRTVLTADSKEVLARWNSAVNSVDKLNALDLNYPNYGFKVFGETVNSNSTYNTLGQIMGVPAKDFPGRLEPGIDNLMVSPEEIKKLRTHDYPVLEEPRIDAAPQKTGALDPRDQGHPDHALYAQIRSGMGKLSTQQGRPWDESNDRITAGLLCDAKEGRLTRIDHLLGSEARGDLKASENILLVQGPLGDPAHNRTCTNVAEVARTPEAESFRRLEAINQQLAQENPVQQRTSQLSNAQPEYSGPTMRA